MSKRYLPFLLLITSFLIIANSSVPAQEKPTPSELISYEDPRQLALSPNGEKVIIQTRKANIAENNYEKSVWLIDTESQENNKKLSLPEDAKSIEWLPDGDQIAYLARAKKQLQVWIKHIESDSTHQITSEPAGVREFSVAPDGKSIAYSTIDIQAMRKAGKKTKQERSGGIEIDMLTFSAFQINNQLQRDRPVPTFQLFVSELDANHKKLVSDSLHVKDFRWSPNGNNIALTVVNSPKQNTGIPARGNNLAIYNQQSDKLTLIAKGKQNPTSFYEDVISYSKPFWSPSGDRLGFLRTDYSDRWATTSEVGIYHLENNTKKLITDANHQDLYKPIFHWHRNNHIYIETTQEALRGLFVLDITDSTISPVNISESYQSQFSFNTTGKRVSWIKERVNQPPELYFTKDEFEQSEKLSSFSNKNFTLPKIKSLTWKSEDGTEVQGWYIYPKNIDKESPPPVITLIHGGPGIPVSNKYHPYLNQWPFPIQHLTAKGYALFIPNYRHTNSFGKQFKIPEKPDKEPLKDVMTGINYLINKQLADKKKLGLMGHSHGGWLGPMVAAEKPIFRAASFAEGFGNYISMYGHINGARNKGLHEYYLEATPYENTDRYVELSPIFKDSLTTQIPTLLEFGQKSPMAKQGVEFAKAFWRHDTPHELIIYPNEGHSIRSPKMQVDAMQRNIDWFEKWVPVE